MEERTRAYLRGRFRDYYRQRDLELPPEADRREWGYIPFSSGSTTMIRHLSLLEMGSLEEFLQRKRPRHVYFSAGLYDDPGVERMEDKGWQGSDLIFDLDADHLPGVDPDETTYAEMLSACKDALSRLLDIVENDFGFEDLTVVFSGGRGYHVHVRDPGVRQLQREDRREIVEYVRGIDVDAERLVSTETVSGTAGRETPAQKRTLDTDGGWSARVHRRVCDLVDELEATDEEKARQRLREFEGIGEGRAKAIARAIEENANAVRAGNVDVHGSFKGLVETLAEETVRAERAPVDEPVTTDTHRLIRLPGSLHGGSGLEVQRIDRSALGAFDPLEDAVPETFVGHDIAIDVTDVGDLPPRESTHVGEIELAGDRFTVKEGTGTYPEYLGVFLMCRGRAEKERE